MSTGDPVDPFDEVVLDDDFIAAGPRELPAEERIAKASRIARSNDRLKAAGEIADGSGKPRYSRLRKSTPWIAIAVVVAVAIVVIAVIAR
jgi:hypothetical protein